ncbi:hypothetical protein ES703_02408 [subsurface metagenome]
MNHEFEDCLKRKKIKEFSRGRALCEKEFRIAKSDLKRAKTSLANKDYKWATIQSYYSMFHSARALLYAKNYRERSHYCLIVAMRTLYVEKKLLPLHLVEGFKKAKTLRENADYYDEWSEIGAKTILKLAKEFLAKSTEILK